MTSLIPPPTTGGGTPPGFGTTTPEPMGGGLDMDALNELLDSRFNALSSSFNERFDSFGSQPGPSVDYDRLGAMFNEGMTSQFGGLQDLVQTNNTALADTSRFLGGLTPFMQGGFDSLAQGISGLSQQNANNQANLGDLMGGFEDRLNSRIGDINTDFDTSALQDQIGALSNNMGSGIEALTGSLSNVRGDIMGQFGDLQGSIGTLQGAAGSQAEFLAGLPEFMQGGFDSLAQGIGTGNDMLRNFQPDMSGIQALLGDELDAWQTRGGWGSTEVDLSGLTGQIGDLQNTVDGALTDARSFTVPGESGGNGNGIGWITDPRDIWRGIGDNGYGDGWGNPGEGGNPDGGGYGGFPGGGVIPGGPGVQNPDPETVAAPIDWNRYGRDGGERQHYSQVNISAATPDPRVPVPGTPPLPNESGGVGHAYPPGMAAAAPAMAQAPAQAAAPDPTSMQAMLSRMGLFG